jgi:hypothetical protein
MNMTDTVKGKVQRILADELGSVEIDRDGDFIVKHESTMVFVSVFAFNDDDEDSDIVVRCLAPMVTGVPLTPEVFKWVAVDGQRFHFGSCFITPEEDPANGWIYFKYAIVGNDLDSNELLSAVYRTAFTANDFDDKLKEQFGGKLFTES